jgi:hypothetical protein
MKSHEGEGANAGAVPLRPITGSVGCRIIDKMRRATPKGAAKPWKTRENIELVERVAGAGVSAEELEAYVEGAAALVTAGGESPQYWSVRQLFTSPTLDWWRNKVEMRAESLAKREAHELDRQARELREQEERRLRRELQRSAPANLDVRRAAKPVQDAVVARARMQELSASVLSRLTGAGDKGPQVGCPRCDAVVQSTERKCPACGQLLIDASGRNRGRRVG